MFQGKCVMMFQSNLARPSKLSSVTLFPPRSALKFLSSSPRRSVSPFPVNSARQSLSRTVNLSQGKSADRLQLKSVWMYQQTSADLFQDKFKLSPV